MVDELSLEGVDVVIARWAHRGAAADTVRSLKYRRATATVSILADELAAVAPRADVVTWVPSTPEHRRRRGFDPSELLARAVARRLHLRSRRLLVRLDSTAQTVRDLTGRRAGPTLRGRGRGAGLRVLVVDDVCTTGATLQAAASALRGRGAISVVAVVATAVVPGPTMTGGTQKA